MIICKCKKVMVSSEMDLKPFMNLMVVLIPMLLVSAEFSKVTVIDINLPADDGVRVDRHDLTCDNSDGKLLKLTAIITDSAITIGAKGGFLPTVFYREYHQYVAKDDQSKFVVKYDKREVVKHPVTGRVMSKFERNDIYLYCCNENGSLRKGYYTKYNELLTSKEFVPVDSVKQGDTLFTVTNPRRMVVVTKLTGIELRNLSVYDEFQNRLSMLKERYRDVSDNDKLTIAAENEVLYDKIVQIMDKAKAADYSDISIAKVRT
jgi:biopolymer transport protein ExbD